jgi:hypothetical protein
MVVFPQSDCSLGALRLPQAEPGENHTSRKLSRRDESSHIYREGDCAQDRVSWEQRMLVEEASQRSAWLMKLIQLGLRVAPLA